MTVTEPCAIGEFRVERIDSWHDHDRFSLTPPPPADAGMITVDWDGKVMAMVRRAEMFQLTLPAENADIDAVIDYVVRQDLDHLLHTSGRRRAYSEAAGRAALQKRLRPDLQPDSGGDATTYLAWLRFAKMVNRMCHGQNDEQAPWGDGYIGSMLAHESTRQQLVDMAPLATPEMFRAFHAAVFPDATAPMNATYAYHEQDRRDCLILKAACARIQKHLLDMTPAPEA